MSERLGVWLYAVTRDLDPAQLAGLTGVAGEPVRAIGASGLAAVVGSVCLDDYGEQALRRNLEDLDWLEVTARAHDAVANVVMRLRPTLPMRLATVYLDDERVLELLRERRMDLDTALRRIQGRTERGVKAYADPETLIKAVSGEPAGGTAGRGSGTAYLLRRRAQLAARPAVEQKASEYATEIHRCLMRIAEAGRLHPPQHPQLLGKQAWMVLNGTYLVADEHTDDFAGLVAALTQEHEGITLELTGPWPPYSFTSFDEEPT